MLDLFGEQIETPTPRGKHYVKVNGYAARPGSGPAGESCGTCIHDCPEEYHNKIFHKCAMMKHAWTHGPGSDIRVRSPACSFWSAQEAATKREETLRPK